MDKTKTLPAAEATEVVAGATTVEKVQGVIAGDARVTVQRAADARVAVLEPEIGVIEAAEILAPMPRVDVTDEALAQPGRPLAAGTTTGRVRTRWPVGRFEHDVPGVEAITAQGVQVPAEKVDALLAAARDANTELEEVV